MMNITARAKPETKSPWYVSVRCCGCRWWWCWPPGPPVTPPLCTRRVRRIRGSAPPNGAQHLSWWAGAGYTGTGRLWSVATGCPPSARACCRHRLHHLHTMFKWTETHDLERWHLNMSYMLWWCRTYTWQIICFPYTEHKPQTLTHIQHEHTPRLHITPLAYTQHPSTTCNTPRLHVTPLNYTLHNKKNSDTYKTWIRCMKWKWQ